MKYYIEIVSFDSGEVVKQIECVRGEAQAHQAVSGVNINLNHDLYFTRVVEEGKQVQMV
jgi:ABC-type uncharacterized transport system substrate-binding protein